MSADPMDTIADILGFPPAEQTALAVAADPIADLLERARNARVPENAIALTQAATVLAIREQTQQLRIANLVAVFGLEPYWADRLVSDEETVIATIREGLGL